MNTRADFLPVEFYHVYNQTNGNELLFRSRENRRFFLARFAHFLKPFCYIHAYALLSNHFHFSIAIKSVEEIDSYILDLPKEEYTSAMLNWINAEDKVYGEKKALNYLICDQFKRLITSYTRSFNKAYGRSGSLFRQKFKRSIYDPEVKFRYLQYYIHHNARKHGMVKNFLDYEYHSYYEIANELSGIVNLTKVLDWFEDLEEFISFHHSIQYEDVFKEIDFDDFLKSDKI